MFYPREAEKDHLYNRAILLTVACCIFLMFAAMARREGSIYAAVQLSATETTGTVTQIENIPMYRDRSLVHYQYTDHDGQTHEDEYLDEHYQQKAHYEIDGPVSLVYSNWFPQKNCIASELHSHRPGFFIMVGGLLLSLLCLVVSARTIARIFAMKQEDHFY